MTVGACRSIALRIFSVTSRSNNMIFAAVLICLAFQAVPRRPKTPIRISSSSVNVKLLPNTACSGVMPFRVIVLFFAFTMADNASPAMNLPFTSCSYMAFRHIVPKSPP